eukprot:9920533-Ditylum_brightwellii.AAC.1
MRLSNYCATYSNATLCYHASNMILHVHSDASYLTVPEGCSRTGGHFFLSNVSKQPSKPPPGDIPLNSPVHNLWEVMWNVVASVAEAEVGALFLNAQMEEQLRIALAEMGHHQLPTPICKHNSTADNITNNKLKQHWSHAIDMCFYLAHDRYQQDHFIIYWHPGKKNM